MNIPIDTRILFLLKKRHIKQKMLNPVCFFFLLFEWFYRADTRSIDKNTNDQIKARA